MSGVKGRSGRKKAPVDRRLRRGTLAVGDVDVVPDVVDRPVPDPPRPLGGVGLRLWEACWLSGSWLHGPDAELLALVCEQMDDRQAERVRYLKDPEKYWRAGVMARKLEQQIKLGLSELGFSPVARAGMNLALASTVEKVTRIQEPPRRRAMSL